MFIRFVALNIDRSSGRRQGIFQAAEALRKSGTLSDADHKQLDDIGTWFDARLKKPVRLAVSPRPHSKAQAISWFKDTAHEHIAQMREMQHLLERYGITVEMIKTNRVGYILYEDEFQVAAYPFAETKT
jgi:hypothetical protein